MDRNISISMAFGTHPSLDHNARKASAVAGQEHIKKGGEFEIWINEDPEQAYDKVFGKALAEYNERQKRPGRRIKNYRLKIKTEEEEFRKKSALEKQNEVYGVPDDSSDEEGGKGKQTTLKHHARHELYETIIQIGNKKSYEGKEFTKEESKKILKEAVKEFERANPNVHVVQAVFHADEQGAPHVHVVWFPFADGFKKGMRRQNSLTGALRAEGYETDTEGHRTGEKWETAQRKWEAGCVDTFASIVTGHGFTVTSQNVGHSHMSTAEYKKFMEWLEAEGYDRETIDSLKASYEETIENLKAENEKLTKENENLATSLSNAKTEAKNEYDEALRQNKNEYDEALRQKQKEWNTEKETLTEKTSELSEKAAKWDVLYNNLPGVMKEPVSTIPQEVGDYFKGAMNFQLYMKYHADNLKKHRYDSSSKGDGYDKGGPALGD